MAQMVTLHREGSDEKHDLELYELQGGSGRLDWAAVEKVFSADLVEIKGRGLPGLLQEGPSKGLTRATFQPGSIILVTVSRRAQGQSEREHVASQMVTSARLLQEWAPMTEQRGIPVYRWGPMSAEFLSWWAQKQRNLLRLAQRLNCQVRLCTVEPDCQVRSGSAGSYVHLGRLMKRVYELVDVVDTEPRPREVPENDLLRLKYNMAGGPYTDGLVDIRMGMVTDDEEILLDAHTLSMAELKVRKGAREAEGNFKERMRKGVAQMIGYTSGVSRSLGRMERLVPSLVSDGVGIRATLVQMATGDPRTYRLYMYEGALLLGTGAGELRCVDTGSDAYVELVYVIWLARRQFLRLRAAGLQKDKPLRPHDVLKVTTGSTSIAAAVVKPLAPARVKGGVYHVTCMEGPLAGQDMVLKHSGSPSELAQLRERRIDTSAWHQVVREREALKQLGDAATSRLPRLYAAGQLAGEMLGGYGKLAGADALLTGPLGSALPEGPLPSEQIVRLAADLAEATLALLECGIWHNDIKPPNVVVQPQSSPGPSRYMLVDLGGAACPRLDDEDLIEQLCPGAAIHPLMSLRPSVLDLLYGSYQAISDELLSPSSDLQSVVHTLVVLAGGELPWAEAAAAGDVERVEMVRRELLARGQFDSWPALACLPGSVRPFAVWVLEQAMEPQPDVDVISDLRTWHQRLSEAACMAASRFQPLL